MSIVLRQRCLVTDFSAVPFHTRHGVAFQYIPRNSAVHQKVPIATRKRQQKVSFKPSKRSQTKPESVQQKPVQAPINTVNQEQTKPVHEKPPSTIKTLRKQNPKKERFASSVTMGAAPSPKHVPVPMFCLREKIN